MTTTIDTQLRRPSWVEVRLPALAQNVQIVRRLVGKEAEVLGVIKSDAYGHGLLPVAWTLWGEGVRWLGVGSVEEGRMLRTSGIEGAIVVMGPILPEMAGEIAQLDLISMVSSSEVAVALDRAGQKISRPVTVHVKIDTGMGRLGMWPQQVRESWERWSTFPGLRLDGICTHLSTADRDDDPMTADQLRAFRAVIKDLSTSENRPRCVHVANSAAILRYPEAHSNLVRPGLMLYGASTHQSPEAWKLAPVLSVRSRIVHVKDVPSGTSVSYGATHVTNRPSRLAVVPLGYGDGYPRAASGEASVLIRGRRTPVLGMICMDQMVIDVTEHADVSIGEDVTLLGAQGDQAIRALEIAEWSGTIPYEILTGFGRTLPRHYIE